jgi:hypothetical protein
LLHLHNEKGKIQRISEIVMTEEQKKKKPTKLGYLFGDTTDGLTILISEFKSPPKSLKGNPQIEDVLKRLETIYQSMRRENNYIQEHDIQVNSDNHKRMITDVRSTLQEFLNIEEVSKVRDARIDINNIISRIDKDLE